MNDLLHFRAFSVYLFNSVRKSRVMQSFGLRTHKKHMINSDRIPMPYIQPNDGDGTKTLASKMWLERFQQCFEGNFEKDLETMMNRLETKKKKLSRYREEEITTFHGHQAWPYYNKWRQQNSEQSVEMSDYNLIPKLQPCLSKWIFLITFME